MTAPRPYKVSLRDANGDRTDIVVAGVTEALVDDDALKLMNGTTELRSIPLGSVVRGRFLPEEGQ